MRKRNWVLLGPLILMAGGLVAGLSWPSYSKLTRANMEKVQQGMTRAEVEAILGAPPGDYAAEGTLYSPCDRLWLYEALWTCDDGWLGVMFDDSGRVAVCETGGVF